MILDSYLAKYYIDKATALEESGNLEGAYELYKKAADAGSSDAMFKLFELYMSKGFHEKEENNMLGLMLSGKPVMPWDVKTHKSPDVQAGEYWLRRAAESGHVDACFIYGHSLCSAHREGEGFRFLEKAKKGGHEQAGLWCSYFSRHQPVSDERYNVMLERFSAPDGKINLMQAGFLKDGTPSQLARYGYKLMSMYNGGLIDAPSLNFYMPSWKGIPCYPIAAKRGCWETFIRVNKDALPHGTLLTFTSDIDIKYLIPKSLHGLRIIGEAVYKSPSFGWLKVEKKAIVMLVDNSVCLDLQKTLDVAQRYKLHEEEYSPANVAFFEEDGEKEYSVEIAEIKGTKLNVLCRYTIGGDDYVMSHFTPELISLTISLPKNK